jgi:hypothetical protein
MPGKFVLDMVPGGDPLIYITQQGRPRIVLFGDPMLIRPLLISTWSDRLLITSDGVEDPIRLYYRNPKTQQPLQMTIPPLLSSVVPLFAHKTTPEDPAPGLDLTYSETVGALHAIHQAGGTAASFATERDRLLAELTSAAQSPETKDRPETPGDKEEIVVFDQPVVTPGEAAPTPEGPRIVPLEPLDPKKSKKK